METRQFIVLLMNAYSIAPDAKPADNFADAGDTWYTGYLAAAKRLGISAGVGNNMFAPGKEINPWHPTGAYELFSGIAKISSRPVTVSPSKTRGNVPSCA